ncbi:response regulator [Dyadobacter sp. LJ53]|uniref:response regulator n=1 Tax=Dyadobacter chenwenxiniae TaxID=2906456 RepID=UPI001F214812|nr:response regulator [Dyadobacter chenwenxiniae]MCF0051701.1 response regulator [Dyadobacter chenwenxiniae]
MAAIKTIYLVDDDEDWRLLVKEAVNEAGIPVKVIEADNGQSLFKILQREVKNAIVILDVNMPVMNGLETLEALRASSHWGSLPIFLVSTSDSYDLALTAIRKGPTRFVTKPVHFNEFVSLVKELCTSCDAIAAR